MFKEVIDRSNLIIHLLRWMAAWNICGRGLNHRRSNRRTVANMYPSQFRRKVYPSIKTYLLLLWKLGSPIYKVKRKIWFLFQTYFPDWPRLEDWITKIIPLLDYKKFHALHGWMDGWFGRRDGRTDGRTQHTKVNASTLTYWNRFHADIHYCPSLKRWIPHSYKIMNIWFIAFHRLVNESRWIWLFWSSCQCYNSYSNLWWWSVLFVTVCWL